MSTELVLPFCWILKLKYFENSEFQINDFAPLYNDIACFWNKQMKNTFPVENILVVQIKEFKSNARV